MGLSIDGWPVLLYTLQESPWNVFKSEIPK